MPPHRGGLYGRYVQVSNTRGGSFQAVSIPIRKFYEIGLFTDIRERMLGTDMSKNKGIFIYLKLRLFSRCGGEERVLGLVVVI